jgi:hypothetical protein
MGAKPKFRNAVSVTDASNVDIVSRVLAMGNPAQSEINPFRNIRPAILNNPDMFAKTPGHFDKALIDTPVAELNKMYKDHPEGLPVSGGDLAKMGSSRLTPGVNIPLFDGMPTAHLYKTTAPSDRAQDPNRRFNMETPNEGTD